MKKDNEADLLRAMFPVCFETDVKCLTVHNYPCIWFALAFGLDTNKWIDKK
jgi:hypothetical protein